jgi:hypothetical protein
MFDSYKQFCGLVVGAFGASPPPDVPLPSQPQLSNVGRVDGKVLVFYPGVNSVTVNRVEPVLDSMVTTPVVFQWSFSGTSYINICYNENWSTDEFMGSFLRRIGEVLRIGLAVGS